VIFGRRAFEREGHAATDLCWKVGGGAAAGAMSFPVTSTPFSLHGLCFFTGFFYRKVFFFEGGDEGFDRSDAYFLDHESIVTF
jgi:hypothetical protein